nr:AlNc14C52G4074 [Albugo laibachii Nc14]|eukprot:CCA18557.1 AlNc14C52G4074 [Albugo laibachii Nc14]
MNRACFVITKLRNARNLCLTCVSAIQEALVLSTGRTITNQNEELIGGYHDRHYYSRLRIQVWQTASTCSQNVRLCEMYQLISVSMKKDYDTAPVFNGEKPGYWLGSQQEPPQESDLELTSSSMEQDPI